MAKKYIDADLLRKEIEFAKTVYDNPKRVVQGAADAFRQDGRAAMCEDILKKIDALQQEQQDELIVTAVAFLDALSRTPYNNKPITDAQVIVKQLLVFLDNPKLYDPDAISKLEQQEADLKRNRMKEAPDKVYVQLGSEVPIVGFVGPAWDTLKDSNRSMIKYINKDTLLKWAEEQYSKCSNIVREDIGKREVLKKILFFINSV